MTDTIELRAIRALGCHGVLEEERGRAQPFEVDIDLEVDLRAAGATDDLSDTVDYGAVADAVRAVIEGEHAELLEHLAHRIAGAVVQAADSTPTPPSTPAVAGVTVVVRKLRPPVAVDMASAGVRIHRRAQDLV